MDSNGIRASPIAVLSDLSSSPTPSDACPSIGAHLLSQCELHAPSVTLPKQNRVAAKRIRSQRGELVRAVQLVKRMVIRPGVALPSNLSFRENTKVSESSRTLIGTRLALTAPRDVWLLER